VVKFRARGSFTISLGNHRVEHPAKRVMSIFLNEHWSRRPLGISTHGIWIGSLHGSAKTAWLVRGFNYTCHGRNRLDPQAVADQVPAESCNSVGGSAYRHAPCLRLRYGRDRRPCCFSRNRSVAPQLLKADAAGPLTFGGTPISLLAVIVLFGVILRRVRQPAGQLSAL
jgi:hypothetical protein